MAAEIQDSQPHNKVTYTPDPRHPMAECKAILRAHCPPDLGWKLKLSKSCLRFHRNRGLLNKMLDSRNQ